ncbi:O-fucosyltransferase family protein [Sporobolomyces koalae]|uniref:O-fucosyltransferase family protein n=1 Tax=Sporobolomyces koalae TaxID=500713 RepID=UPI003172D33E
MAFRKVSTSDSDTEKGFAMPSEEDPVVRRMRQSHKWLWSDRPLAAKVGIVIALSIIGYNLLLTPTTDRDQWQYGTRKLRTTSPTTNLAQRVPTPATLLTSAAPAKSYHDALRPDLRYLTLDSWSGMTGQHLTALSLMYLAQLTQRVAIIPSWRDADHYGEAMIRMSDLFDLDKYRNETGALFVEWDDVKPLDRSHEKTVRDEIGCVMGNNAFEGGRSFDEHNLAQTVWRVPRVGEGLQHSIESFVLFDFDREERDKRIKKFAKQNNYTTIPANMLNDQLLCYSNLWDLNHASAHAGGVSWYDGFKGQQVAEGDAMTMLPISHRGTHPEWWAVGQYVDFSPAVWDIALDATLRTLKTKTIPKDLITVHLRRGDFKSWCSTGHNCTPAIDRYVEKVAPMLANAPRGTKVLVTTDEQDDRIFLDSIDSLGWYRIDHRALGTFETLEKRYGDAARWYDAAIDQAILSLGTAFVGTSGSQVSLVTELRVAAWNGGSTALVERPA